MLPYNPSHAQSLISILFIEDDERGNHAWHPAANGEYEDNEDGAASFVNHRQRWKNDSKDDSPNAHKSVTGSAESFL